MGRSLASPELPACQPCRVRPSFMSGIHIVKLIQACSSLATETDYVRGNLAAHAKQLLDLGTDGFRLDAAKRMPPHRCPVAPELTFATLSDIPVDDIRAILALSGKPSYVTQEVRVSPIRSSHTDRLEHTTDLLRWRTWSHSRRIHRDWSSTSLPVCLRPQVRLRE